MPTKLIMPLLGEAVTDATVTKWLKSVGDQVEEYEAVLEVNTDKVDTEIPCPVSGVVLAELVKEGEVVKVGTLLGWIGRSGEPIPQVGAIVQPIDFPLLESTFALPNVAPSAHPTPPHELGFISPVVAKIAAEQNVDLSTIQGTGMGGRITKRDIEKFVEDRKSISASPSPISSPASTPTAVLSSEGNFTIHPQTPMRKAIAEHMVMSEHTAPHVSTVMEVDMSCVMDHRNSNKEIFSSEGVNLT
jgi:2-oxoisovalerate dehydrogenase E2 component (dihydrolipoyl transacylase)